MKTERTVYKSNDTCCFIFLKVLNSEYGLEANFKTALLGFLFFKFLSASSIARASRNLNCIVGVVGVVGHHLLKNRLNGLVGINNSC